MARTLLIRGMLLGVVAAVVAFVVARLLGEHQLDLAIGFEDAHDAGHAAAHDAGHAAAHAGGDAAVAEELVSRTTQRGVGLLVGLLAFSVAIGGIFALTYAGLQGRLGTLGARATAALLALGGFVAVYLLPVLKYPANPPAVGDPETIGRRTALYFGMVAISLVVVVGGGVATRRLADRFGAWNAALLAVAGGLVVIGLAYQFMPAPDPTPQEFPADVLWRFRLASLAIQASVWATIGLLFGALTERQLRVAAAAASQRPPTSVGSSVPAV